MTTGPLDRLSRSYRAAFLRYLVGNEEAALHVGYEIGRSAATSGLSLLDVAQVHHRVLLEALQATPADRFPELATAASDFLVEVLATFDMMQRAVPHQPGTQHRLNPPTDSSDPSA